MNTIALSVFPDASRKEIALFGKLFGGREGQLVGFYTYIQYIYIYIYTHNIYFCFVFPQNLSANGGNKMESAPVRGKAAPCTGMINIPARLAAHHCSGTLASPLTAGTGPSETTAGWRNGRSQDFNWRSLSKRTEALFFFLSTNRCVQ